MSNLACWCPQISPFGSSRVPMLTVVQAATRCLRAFARASDVEQDYLRGGVAASVTTFGRFVVIVLGALVVLAVLAVYGRLGLV